MKATVIGCLLIGASIVPCPMARAATWISDTTGTNGNWSSVYSPGVQPGWSNAVPNAQDAVANMPTVDNQNPTILLDMNATISALVAVKRTTLVLNSDGTHVLTFSSSNGQASITNSNRGSFTINPDIVLAGASLTINRSGGENTGRLITVNGSISGTGDLVLAVSGLGAMTLGGLVNPTGAISNNTVTGMVTTISGTIGSNVASISKAGAGLLILSGSNNAFSGATSLDAGTTRVTRVSGLSTGNVSVASGATLDIRTNDIFGAAARLSLAESGGVYARVSLAAGTSNTVAELDFNGLAQSPGTWGASGSGALHTDDNYFSGTGLLNVIPEPSALGLAAAGLVTLLSRRRRR